MKEPIKRPDQRNERDKWKSQTKMKEISGRVREKNDIWIKWCKSDGIVERDRKLESFNI